MKARIETVRDACRLIKGTWCHLTRLERINEQWETVEYLPGESVGYGQQETTTPEDATWFVVDDTTGSDYAGSSVTRANYESMRDAFPNVVATLHGGHGTYAIAIPLAIDDPAHALHEHAEEIKDILAGLSDYPVIDEQCMSEIELRWEDEFWRDTGADDFRAALRKELQTRADGLNAIIQAMTLDELWDMLRSLYKDDPQYEYEHSGAYLLDMEKIAIEIAADLNAMHVYLMRECIRKAQEALTNMETLTQEHAS